MSTATWLSRSDANGPLQVLSEAEIPDVERRSRCYPHEFSGGMRQRVMIAMALACQPAIVIADEPTTALDVTTQANIVALLDRLRRQHNSSVIFVTHDLSLLAQLADRVMVMYAGQCVESGRISDIYQRPCHPYTIAMLEASPSARKPGERLVAIEGAPPLLTELPEGCAFAPRCSYVKELCRHEMPQLEGGWILRSLGEMLARRGRARDGTSAGEHAPRRLSGRATGSVSDQHRR